MSNVYTLARGGITRFQEEPLARRAGGPGHPFLDEDDEVRREGQAGFGGFVPAARGPVGGSEDRDAITPVTRPGWTRAR